MKWNIAVRLEKQTADTGTYFEYQIVLNYDGELQV
jgi:hypothetical protein